MKGFNINNLDLKDVIQEFEYKNWYIVIQDTSEVSDCQRLMTIFDKSIPNRYISIKPEDFKDFSQKINNKILFLCNNQQKHLKILRYFKDFKYKKQSPNEIVQDIYKNLNTGFDLLEIQQSIYKWIEKGFINDWDNKFGFTLNSTKINKINEFIEVIED